MSLVNLTDANVYSFQAIVCIEYPTIFIRMNHKVKDECGL